MVQSVPLATVLLDPVHVPPLVVAARAVRLTHPRLIGATSLATHYHPPRSLPPSLTQGLWNELETLLEDSEPLPEALVAGAEARMAVEQDDKRDFFLKLQKAVTGGQVGCARIAAAGAVAAHASGDSGMVVG